ncbi:MAG: WG repeat-containing protein, partial [Desulfuromonadaceae bacterium]
MKRIMTLVLFAFVICSICTACQQEAKKVVLDNSLRLLVKFNGKYGYCDRGGTTVIPPQFDSASLFSEGLAAVHVNGKNGFIDANGT